MLGIASLVRRTMAGHSKWANIKHRKGRQDARRSQVMTRISKEIMAAVRMGSEPHLQAVITRARHANMPKDKIQHAIDRGNGVASGELAEHRYETYRSGVGFVVEAVTDSDGRTRHGLATINKKHGADFANSGAVLFGFHRRGAVDGRSADVDGVEAAAIDAGAEDVAWHEDDHFVVECAEEDMHGVADALRSLGAEHVTYSAAWVPSAPTLVAAGSEDADKLEAYLSALRTAEDVEDVFPGFEIVDEDEDGDGDGGAR